ncbi:MAG: DUF2232 domain-containing protein [bacterium]|nr:MAG: DUF2232 domain-containing protein [bacterium]
MTETSRGREAGLWLRLVGFALIPLSVQVFQPTIGGSLGILAPLPLAYGMARRGYLEGTAAVAFVALVTSIVIGAGQGLYFLFETLPLCFGIGWTARSRTPLYGSVVKAVGLVALTAFAAVGVFGLVTGTPPAQLYQDTVQQMGLFMDGVTQTTGLEPEQQQQMYWIVSLWQRLFIGIWLSTLTLVVIFYSLLVRGWLLAAKIIEEEGLAMLTEWRLPFYFVGAFVALASAVLLTSGLARDVALNCLIPLGTLYGIQGIVIAGHLFTRWALPPFFRIMILAFGIISVPLATMIIVALGGLFDTWLDFRRRWPIEIPPTPPQA